MVSVQWLFVYAVLITELVLSAVLILPLPDVIKKPAIQHFTSLWRFAQVRRFLLGVFLIIAILFLDTVRLLAKVEEKKEKMGAVGAAELRIQQFRNQRNFYLTGFALFQLVLLYRVQHYLAELLELRQRVKESKSK
mmetsp:Transcript_9080/g.21486  ORF Transcript_9080/g.21486 Transcript_9080/m.21486 type:complete len:136 (+) Transcript_9080:146-553(+)